MISLVKYYFGQEYPMIADQYDHNNPSKILLTPINATNTSAILTLASDYTPKLRFPLNFSQNFQIILFLKSIKISFNQTVHNKHHPLIIDFPFIKFTIKMYSKNVKVLAVVLFLIAGTISTFAYKLQGSVTVKQGEHEKKFFHPYMQAFTMFIGEAFCILLYFKNKNNQQTPLQEGKTPHTPWIFFVPALADSCSSILQYMGLSFISGSTYMMFKGASIVTTAIFSKILIKMVLEKRHFVGCGMAILGIVIVGTSGFLESDTKGQSTFDKQLIGYVLMLISLIFNGFFYAYEQFLLKKHSINPMQMVGYEGVFGMGIILVVTTILSFIPCTFNEKACVYDTKNQPYIELPLVFVSQLFEHIILLILVVCGLISIGVFNLNGLKITKMFDALTRSLLNVTKTGAIWVVGITITLIADGNLDFKLQSLNIGVNLVKILGFTVIITGTLIYNKLIFKKYFSLEESQSDAFKKNYASLTSSDGSLTVQNTLLQKNNRIQ